jgi:hypothetical protein
MPVIHNGSNGVELELSEADLLAGAVATQSHAPDFKAGVDWLLAQLIAHTPAEAPTDDEPLPAVGSLWRHTSGRVYCITDHFNVGSMYPDRYPPMLGYANTANGSLWCRRAADWHRSFTPYVEVQA